MNDENDLLIRACAFLGISVAEVVRSEIGRTDILVLYYAGIKGTPKVRVPLEKLATIDLTRPADPVPEEPTVAVSPQWTSLGDGLFCNGIGNFVDILGKPLRGTALVKARVSWDKLQKKGVTSA